MKNQYIERDCLARGELEQFADWRGAWLERSRMVFLRRGDTPMYTMHSDLSTLYYIWTPWKWRLGEGNIIFCCTVSRENYFVSVIQQNNYIDTKFHGTFKNNIDHQGRETCAIFGFPINNKNSVRNSFLPFFLDFNIIATISLKKLSFFNIRFLLV